MQKESTESKIIWNIGCWIKNLFAGGSAVRRGRIDKRQVALRWQEIENKLKLSGTANFQSAVMEADKLLDYCLKSLGAKGETMGERLKNSENLFHDRASYQAAWEGHKERNRIVHEHDYEFLHHQAKSAIDNFRKALKDIQAI